MVTQDVDVINYSVGDFWDGPGDGTSPFSNSPLRNVDTAVASGITWINVAGNEAMATWYGASNRTPFDPRYSTRFQRWSGSDIFNCVFLTEGQNFTAQLRWDDAWGGARRDLDLSLFNSEIEIVSYSYDLQNGGALHIPFEILRYTPSTSGIYCLTVSHENSNPTVPSWIQLQAFSGETLRYHTPHHSIGNPAESANPGMLAVGATHYWDTRAIAGYSSQGPTPDGRTKPDIVGAACGAVASYDIRPPEFYDGNNCWFSGTSQASPHVAGLAALVKQRFPEDSPHQVAQYLKSNAEARGAVPNNTWGYGFAKLPASDVAAPTPEPTSTAEPTPIPTAGTKPEPTVMPTEVPTTVPIDTPVPTPIPSATPEPTPVVPQVPEEVLTRIGALETLVATLQGLITTLQSTIAALDVRVAALETSASAPTPIPTTPPTPTTVPSAPTPTPTATLVPGAPTPTVTPTATPEPDPCELVLPTGTLPLTVTGSWIDDTECVYPVELPNAASGDRYYRWVGFEATFASVDWTATLTSNEDTYMLLWEYDDDSGELTFVDENDDIVRGNTNSGITWTPTLGKSYLLDLTTYDANTLGDFTLTIEAASSGTQGQSSGQSIELSDITLERRQ